MSIEASNEDAAMCRLPLVAPQHTRPQTCAHLPPMTQASLTLVKPCSEGYSLPDFVCCPHSL